MDKIVIKHRLIVSTGLSLLIVCVLVNQLHAQINTVAPKDFFVADTFYTYNLSSRLQSLLESSNPPSAFQLSHNQGTIQNIGSSKKLVQREKKLKTPTEIYDDIKKSVFLVGIFQINKLGKQSAEIIASAYPITEDGICVTNFHVLKDIIDKNLSSRSDSVFYFIETYDGKLLFIDHVGQNDQWNDVAIFRVRNNGYKLNAISIGNIAPVGSKVYCVSNPENNYYFFSEGIVARNYVRKVDANILSAPLKYTMGISAEYSGGSSGSPIVDNRGCLVGMVSATHTMYSGVNNHGQPQMILKNAVPLNVITSLLK